MAPIKNALVGALFLNFLRYFCLLISKKFLARFARCCCFKRSLSFSRFWDNIITFDWKFYKDNISCEICREWKRRSCTLGGVSIMPFVYFQKWTTQNGFYTCLSIFFYVYVQIARAVVWRVKREGHMYIAHQNYKAKCGWENKPSFCRLFARIPPNAVEIGRNPKICIRVFVEFWRKNR